MNSNPPLLVPLKTKNYPLAHIRLLGDLSIKTAKKDAFEEIICLLLRRTHIMLNILQQHGCNGVHKGKLLFRNCTKHFSVFVKDTSLSCLSTTNM